MAAKPIAPASGIAVAFPDVCQTPSTSGQAPIPYPNVAELGNATEKSDEERRELIVGSSYVLLEGAEVNTSSGDEAGSIGGVTSNKTKGKCKITGCSQTVKYGKDGKGIVRFMDETQQNDENASGVVLSSFPTVLVGD